MMKRLRRHLNPSLVISVIALVAAVGGGYAVAFSGSGTLQKAVGSPTASYSDVRTLNGFPTLQAQCDDPNGIDIKFGPNNTGHSVIIDAQEFDNNDTVTVEQDVMADGDAESLEFDLPGLGGEAHFQLSRLSGSKAQVSIDARGANAGGFCSSLAVLALNTVE